jgi:hypothetical protein
MNTTKLSLEVDLDEVWIVNANLTQLLNYIEPLVLLKDDEMRNG